MAALSPFFFVYEISMAPPLALGSSATGAGSRVGLHPPRVWQREWEVPSSAVGVVEGAQRRAAIALRWNWLRHAVRDRTPVSRPDESGIASQGSKCSLRSKGRLDRRLRGANLCVRPLGWQHLGFWETGPARRVCLLDVTSRPPSIAHAVPPPLWDRALGRRHGCPPTAGALVRRDVRLW